MVRPLPPRIDGLVDAHCHLDMPPMSDDLDAALAAARRAGVVQLVHVGCSTHTIARAVEIADARPEVFCAIGIHPHEASTTDAAVLADLEARATAPASVRKVVAIGETGLDYWYDRSPRPDQRRSLAEHVELARRVDLPLVLHVRDAHDEALAIVTEAGPRAERPGMVHCFTGTPDEARRWLDLGFCLSFSGVVTFPKSDALREAARLCPGDRLLLETDAPYLSPVPVRGPQNQPAHVAFTCAHLAGVRGQAPMALAADAAAATRALLALPPAGPALP
jgi:TatD DNase family protein